MYKAQDRPCPLGSYSERTPRAPRSWTLVRDGLGECPGDLGSLALGPWHWRQGVKASVNQHGVEVGRLVERRQWDWSCAL